MRHDLHVHLITLSSQHDDNTGRLKFFCWIPSSFLHCHSPFWYSWISVWVLCSCCCNCWNESNSFSTQPLWYTCIDCVSNAKRWIPRLSLISRWEYLGWYLHDQFQHLNNRWQKWKSKNELDQVLMNIRPNLPFVIYPLEWQFDLIAHCHFHQQQTRWQTLAMKLITTSAKYLVEYARYCTWRLWYHPESPLFSYNIYYIISPRVFKQVDILQRCWLFSSRSVDCLHCSLSGELDTLWMTVQSWWLFPS